MIKIHQCKQKEQKVDEIYKKWMPIFEVINLKLAKITPKLETPDKS